MKTGGLSLRRGNWKIRAGAFVITVGMLMSSVIGCGSQTSPASSGDNDGGQPNQSANAAPTGNATPKQGGTITVALKSEPDTLDMHKSSGLTSVDEIGSFIGGSLVSIDPVSGEVKPSLAESYTISPDGKTWTFKIRSGVTFHDGTKLTAKSFKLTYERLLDPQTGSKSTQFLVESIKSIQAPDDQTLVLELKEPNAPQLLNLAFTGWMQPLSMDAVAKYGNDYGRNPVGVGPWKFASWKTGESITFARNDAYQWGDATLENQGPPRADKLVVKFIADQQTRMAALESGSIDVVRDVAAKDAVRYRNNPKYQLIEQLNRGIGFDLIMNMKTEALQDIQVRKAINLAVNKEAMIKAALNGEGIVAHSMLPPSILGYDKAAEAYDYKYNPDEAKKLLEDAGWKVNGEGIREKNGKPLALTLLATITFGKESQLLQGMLGELGIKLSIKTLEAAAVAQAAVNGEFDLFTDSYTYMDPDILYICFHSSQIGGYNYAQLNDQKLDELVAKGRATIDPEARKKIYAEAQKYMSEQAYVVPIYVDKQFTVINSRVKGVKKVNDYLIFNDSWVEQ